MVSSEDKADREAGQFRSLLGRVVEKRLDAVEKRLDEMVREQQKLHQENTEKISEIKLKMAIMHYKLGLIFAAATAVLTLVGNLILKKFGL